MALASLRCHDRVEDDVRQIEIGNGGVDSFDDRGIREHPDFDGIRADVCRDRFDLRRHQICRQRVPRCDAERVLGRHCRDGRRREHAVRCEGFQVGLNAGACP
jgi:hypothetical protein